MAAHRRDADDVVRVIVRPWTFAGALDAAFNQIRQYGGTSTAVAARVLETLAIVAGRVHCAADAAAVLRHAEMLARAAAESLREPNDRADVRERFERVRRVLAQREERRSAA